MLIGYIAFSRIFGYHPFPSAKDLPISSSTEKIMGPDFKTLRDGGIDATEELKKKNIETLSVITSDGLTLRASYIRCDVPSDKLFILVHGHNSHGMKDNSLKTVGYLAAGYNVLLPDNRACGNSDGKWETFGFRESEDMLLWIDKAVAMNSNCKIVMEGCSMGGATVCLLADKALPANVKTIVSDCAFASAEGEFKFIFKHFAHIPSFPILNSIDFWSKKINKISLNSIRPVDSVSAAKLPMFFVHGAADRYVPAENARILYDHCPTQKELLYIENTGHAAACVKGGKKYFNSVLSFVEKYM